nr:Chain C, gp41 peptide [synthetic construct]
ELLELDKWASLNW